MKHFQLVPIAIAMLVLAPAKCAAQGESSNSKCAVIGFRSNGGQELAEQLASSISSRLVSTRGFVVIERNNLEEVVRQLTLNESGMIEQGGAASFGSISSVDFLIYGVILRPATRRVTGKDLFGAKVTYYQTEISASIRYLSVRTAQIVSEARLTGQGRGASESLAHGDALGDIAAEFVRGLSGSARLAQGKVMRVDTSEKVLWLDQGKADSLKKGDYFEIGYNVPVEFDDGKVINDFKVVCLGRVESVLDSHSKLAVGRFEKGILGIGSGFKRDDKMLATLFELKKGNELIAKPMTPKVP